MQVQTSEGPNGISESSVVYAALTYLEKFNFSVIPVKPDKRPYIRWETFQHKQATKDEIISWWTKWPKAMVGIVTGSVSGIVVIDIDTPEGNDVIQEFVSDCLLIPTCQTPSGGKHLYFKAPETPISNNAKAIPGCDFRGEGGYVVAPPSVNSEGDQYAWLDNLSLDEVEPIPLPKAYIDFVSNKSSKYRGVEQGDYTRPHEATANHKMFAFGRRDNDLFHVANCLVKGCMPINEIQEVLEFIGKSCTPPFDPNEARIKVESALKRAERKERNIAEEVREWVLTTSDHFKTTDCHKELQLTTKQDFKACNMALLRMCKEGVIEKDGNKRGAYRVVDAECEEIDFLNAKDEPLDIHWPFKIERYVKTSPKNIVVIAGEPNAGKTAFLLNVVRANMFNHSIYYFSSEMGDMEFKDRLSKFDLPIKEWKFKAMERSYNFADVVIPEAINIIDYLEVHKDFYEVGGMIKAIYDRLSKGMAVIALQKNKGTDYGLGGFRGLEKPRLYLSMEPGKVKIVKGKNWASQTNPNGLELNFKLVQGCKFIVERDWERVRSNG